MKRPPQTPHSPARNAIADKVYDGRNGKRFVAHGFYSKRGQKDMVRWREIGPCSRLGTKDCKTEKETCKHYNSGRCTRIPQRRLNKALALAETTSEKIDTAEYQAKRIETALAAAERVVHVRKTPEGKDTASEKVVDIEAELEEKETEIDSLMQKYKAQWKKVVVEEKAVEKDQRRSTRLQKEQERKDKADKADSRNQRQRKARATSKGKGRRQ